MPLPQKRSRPRRTYQLDSSSTNAGDGAAGLGDLIGFQPLVDKLDERVELGEQPLIHQRQLDRIERVRLGIEVIDVRHIE